jgi:signal transduction histidine kinase
VDSREANLIVLILENLIGNALQAAPPGSTVQLHCETGLGYRVFRVRDEGPGLPSHVRKHLFTPVQSTKEGGSGIGLALSQQLANHLGAELTLVRSDTTGTEFALSLPAREASHRSTAESLR